MNGSSRDEMGESLRETCLATVEPIARNDTEAWLELVAPRVVVDPSLVPSVDARAGLDELRAALARAGGPRELFGLAEVEPIVVEVEDDCRRCRRPALALRVLGEPGIVLVLEGWNRRRITQIRRVSKP